MIDRRTLMASGLAAGAPAAGRPALAQTAKLNVYAHRVHRTVAAGAAGDIT